jgi:hypothetical protein
MAEKNASEQKNASPKIKRLGAVKPKTGSLRPTERVAEQVPRWLQGLLGKYGEPQGLLVGLQDEYDQIDLSVPRDKPTATGSGLSSVLEQMAETGIPEDVANRSATSVEWGLPAAPPPEAPIDTLLAGLDLDPDLYAAEPDHFDEADDWLAGIVASNTGQPIAPKLPPGFNEAAWPSEGAAPPASTSPETDIPPWLLDSPEDPAANVQPSPGQPSPAEVPDWLSGAMDTPLVGFPPAGPSGEVEFPTWLANAGGPPPAKAVADITDWDVPDWLSDETPAPPQEAELPTLIGSPFTDVPGSGVSGDDIPDWLRTTSAPIDDDQPLDLSGIAAKPAPAAAPAQPARSGWDELRGQMATGTLTPEAAPLPPAPVEPPAAPPACPPAVPDWLADPRCWPDPPPTRLQPLRAITGLAHRGALPKFPLRRQPPLTHPPLLKSRTG